MLGVDNFDTDGGWKYNSYPSESNPYELSMFSHNYIISWFVLMHIYIMRIYIYSSKTLELPELVKLLAVLAHFSSLKFIAFMSPPLGFIQWLVQNVVSYLAGLVIGSPRA